MAESPRVGIETARVVGSVSLRGARIDDVSLRDYRETVEPSSANIVVLSPRNAPQPYHAAHGWVAQAADVALPGDDTVWQASGTVLALDRPLTLTWNNGKGLSFTRVIEIDRDFMLTVTQRVRNTGATAVTLFPFGLISRTNTPTTAGFFILHEGPVGVLDGTLKEFDYDTLRDKATVSLNTVGGWLGFTDKYWLAALVPDQKEALTARFSHVARDGRDVYQTDYLGAARTVASGGETSVVSRLFVGAKEVRLLDAYEEKLGIARFDLAVDFGWFYFLTKPIFYLLEYIYRHIGNFGLSILVLTVMIKLLFFPLANKSYRAMSRLKKLQPKMMELRERFKDDRAGMNQALMEMYRQEKANPMSGCLPILIQIPVFFALYKVLFVTIEMRHTPFVGWIRDLSVADPTSLFNLFGLIPWTPPEFLLIGAWPLIMGVTMYLQQLLNPQPADPVQAKIFLMMPLIFTFMLARFPAGLVIYWAWNNILSILQQWLIMRQMGVSARS